MIPYFIATLFGLVIGVFSLLSFTGCRSCSNAPGTRKQGICPAHVWRNLFIWIKARVQPLGTALSFSRVRAYAEAAGKYPVGLLSAAARPLRCLLRADPDPIFID